MVRVALAGAWLLPRLVCSAPAGMLLVCTPATRPVTLTSIVQPPAGTVPPLFRRTLVALAAATTVPPQVVVMPGVAVRRIWLGAVGSTSSKSALSVLAVALVLPRTMLRRDTPLGGITAGVNCLPTVGGVETISCALVGSSLLTPSFVV